MTVNKNCCAFLFWGGVKNNAITADRHNSDVGHFYFISSIGVLFKQLFLKRNQEKDRRTGAMI